MSDGFSTYVKFALRKRCWENSLYLLTARCLSLFWAFGFQSYWSHSCPPPPLVYLPAASTLSVTILIQSIVREEMARFKFVLHECSAVFALVCGYWKEDISSVETTAGRYTFIFASKIGNSISSISDGGTDSGKSNRALCESRNINTGMPACRFCSSVNALICSHIPIRTGPYSSSVISHCISNKVCLLVRDLLTIVSHEYFTFARSWLCWRAQCLIF